MTSSLRTLEQRLRAVEARRTEVEGGYGDTLYELRRASVRNELRLGRVLEHLAINDLTDDEVDEALDADRAEFVPRGTAPSRRAAVRNWGLSECQPLRQGGGGGAV